MESGKSCVSEGKDRPPEGLELIDCFQGKIYEKISLEKKYQQK